MFVDVFVFVCFLLVLDFVGLFVVFVTSRTPLSLLQQTLSSRISLECATVVIVLFVPVVEENRVLLHSLVVLATTSCPPRQRACLPCGRPSGLSPI